MDANTNVEQTDDTQEPQDVQTEQPAVDRDTAEEPQPKTSKTSKAKKARKAKARLNETLAEKRCPHCLQVGYWRVTSKQKQVRYLKCMACGKRSKIAL